MSKLYNASLDQWRAQCDSITFDFKPGKFAVMCGKVPTTRIPDRVLQFLYDQTKDQGVFILHDGMSDEEIKAAHRQALLNYMSGALFERLKNYRAQEDDFRRRGITLIRDVKYTRALRYEQEIRTLLEMEAPIEEELSFLDHEKRKSIGINDERLQHVPQDLFNPEKILEEATMTAEASLSQSQAQDSLDEQRIENIVSEVSEKEEEVEEAPPIQKRRGRPSLKDARA